MKNPRDTKQVKHPDTFYLHCPYCGAHIRLPDDELDDLFKITECLECERTFDYRIDEIRTKRDTPNVE